jgi:hypothetical protein
MIDALIIIAYSIFYFAAFAWIGGRYSSEMQNLNKLNIRMKSDKFDHEKLLIQKAQLLIRIKKIKSLPIKIFSPVVSYHLILNWLTLNSTEYYYYIVFSCVFFLILLFGVFLLKGHGTIDSNPRMHGGWRM